MVVTVSAAFTDTGTPFTVISVDDDESMSCVRYRPSPMRAAAANSCSRAARIFASNIADAVTSPTTNVLLLVAAASAIAASGGDDGDDAAVDGAIDEKDAENENDDAVLSLLLLVLLLVGIACGLNRDHASAASNRMRAACSMPKPNCSVGGEEDDDDGTSPPPPPLPPPLLL